MKNKRYKLEDLKVGMWIYESELYDICGTHVVLIHSKEVDDDIYGQIGFIGKDITSEVSALNKAENLLIYDYYQSEADSEGEIIYEA